MSRHGGPVTIRPTELVHEAYGRLFGGAERSWADRRHFINSAVAAMRSVLIDRARRRVALRRGGGMQLTAVDELPVGFGGFSIVDLDDAAGCRGDSRAPPRCSVSLSNFWPSTKSAQCLTSRISA
ncbi:MAG: ECF-type sigma factor [Planctomycetota bacterium]